MLVTLAGLAAGSPALAESVKFQIIPDAGSANDLSPDGRYVVGEWDSNGDTIPEDGYVWDRQTGTTTLLGNTDAIGVSDDGAVVVGDLLGPGGSPLGELAARWTDLTGWLDLGHLPNALECPSKSNSYEVSADGNVVVGLSWDGCSGRGFAWRPGTGMVELEALANGGNRASVVSADGTIAAGFAQGNFDRTPAMWDTTTTVGTLLDPTADLQGEVLGMSDDGSILLVEWLGGDGDPNAVTWTAADGPTVIDNGQLIPSWQGIPQDIADDGTIVGFDFLIGNRRAWIAQPVNGGGAAGGGPSWRMQLLETWVTDNGGTIPDGFQPQVCQAISADGRVIIGHSGIPSPGAFIITRCIEDVDGDGGVATSDLLDLIAAWGACVDCTLPGDCPSDFDGNCQVDTVDLLALLANWGDCP